MSGIVGFDEIDRSKIDFWEKDWNTLTKEEKNIFCDLIKLKQREQEGVFIALMAYQSIRKEMGIIKKIM